MTAEEISMDTNFYVGRKVKFSLPTPELRKLTKYGCIIGVYPYVLQVKSDDGKKYTLNKKDFHKGTGECPADSVKAMFIND